MVRLFQTVTTAFGIHHAWRRGDRWIRSFFLGAALLLGAGPALAVPSFTAELEPDQVAAGEMAILKLTYTDLGDAPAPVLPEITNCTVHPAGVSHQFSLINFKQSSSVVHQFSLEPKAQGLVQIPPITVEVDGKKYTSQPLTLRVGQGYDLSGLGILKLSIPRSEVYVGETFPLEVKFLFRNPPDQQAPPTIAMEGFLKGRQKMENLSPETINGEVRSVVRWTLAVTAVKPGDFEIGPAELLTLYRFRDPRRIFGGVEARKLTFSSDAIKVRVVSPPLAGRPAGYEGAVGRYQVEVTASPTNVSVGDPVTVRVRVSGSGNFDGLRLPELPANSGFQSYPGTNSFLEADPLGLTGTKNFEAVLVPEQAGLQRLRWPSLSYWDPTERRYVTDEPRPLQIQVRPGYATQAQPAGTNVVALAGATSVAAPASPTDLALKNDLGTLAIPADAVVAHVWYWGALSFPLVSYAALGLGLWWRKRRREDPAAILRHRARQEVREAVVNLAVHAQAGRPAEFYSALNAALQGQLALTLGGTPGSYTEDVIDSRLVPRGLEVEDADRLCGLFGALALARFSPGSDSGVLSSRQQEAEMVLAALHRLEGPR